MIEDKGKRRYTSTGCDVAITNLGIARASDIDAIGVGTVLGSNYVNIRDG